MPPSKLDHPARKAFVCHLADFKFYEPDGWYWEVPGSRNTVTVEYAWLQGIVVSVDMATDHVFVDDGTGVVKVSVADVRRIKKCKREEMLVEKGCYVMVVGSPQPHEGNKYPVIKAVKLAPLDCETAPHETHWMLEVMHYHKHLRLNAETVTELMITNISD